MGHLIRADRLLVEKGYFSSRRRAQEAIAERRVLIGGKIILKPATLVDENAPIVVKPREREYVSRGGYKLEHALSVFGVDVDGKLCLDVGSSTGGFVDCLLRHGARQVVALDVGKGQLDQRLRRDRRVILLENYNARYLNCADLPFAPQIITVDVSFISVKKIFPALVRCASANAEFIILLKPQFEAGREKVRKGIVRDPAVHVSLLEDFIKYFEEYGYNVEVTPSPIRGAKGNIEYLLHVTKNRTEHPQPAEVVQKAFSEEK